LQEREVRRVGDNKSVSVNVRVVGATNEPLQPMIRSGTFREDLYYRLAVIPVEIPALRERLEDVPLLVNHFLQKSGPSGGTPIKIDPQAIELLSKYDYPGNVRELENAIERACALCENNTIMPSDLPPQIVEFANEASGRKSRSMMSVGKSLDEFIQEQEREYIEATLAKFKGSREKAASVLGISMATLYRKLEIKGKK